jgi:hypothetical protein
MERNVSAIFTWVFDWPSNQLAILFRWQLKLSDKTIGQDN